MVRLRTALLVVCAACVSRVDAGSSSPKSFGIGKSQIVISSAAETGRLLIRISMHTPPCSSRCGLPALQTHRAAPTGDATMRLQNCSTTQFHRMLLTHPSTFSGLPATYGLTDLKARAFAAARTAACAAMPPVHVSFPNRILSFIRCCRWSGSDKSGQACGVDYAIWRFYLDGEATPVELQMSQAARGGHACRVADESGSLRRQRRPFRAVGQRVVRQE